MFKRLAAACAALCLFVLAGHAAWSQARTIRIVVPFPAGGSADILARLLGEHIAKNQGPTVVVENRPGGGASIAYEAVARAAPDGNTLVINGNSIVINPHLRKVNYDPLTSFEPVCYLLSFAAGLRREARTRPTRRSPISSPAPRRLPARWCSRPSVPRPRSTSASSSSAPCRRSTSPMCPIPAALRR